MARRSAAIAMALALAMIGTDARADILKFQASLDGPSESPPNASPGTGWSGLVIDTVAQTLFIQTAFEGLIAPTTVAHIHGPTAVAGAGTASVATQVPTFVGFPAGVTEGSYDNTFDLTDLGTYNPAFVAANGGTAASASAALILALLEGKAYLNIHTSAFPAGEIRGFYQVVPEPSSVALLSAGGIGGFWMLRRRWREAAV